MKNIKTILWDESLKHDVCPSGFIAMKRYGIPVTVTDMSSDEKYPIGLWPDGCVKIDGKDIPLTMVNMEFDMVELNEFPYARRKIAKMVFTDIAITDHVTAGIIRCYVSGCGSVRIWEARALTVKHSGIYRDEAMEKHQKEISRRNNMEPWAKAR